MNDHRSSAPRGNRSGAVSLVIAGETNIQDRFDPVSAFANVRHLLDAADLRFCHLEGPLCEPSADPARPDIPHKLNWRHSDPRMVAALTDAGIDAVSCASNVSYPADAALGSARVLAEAGIAFCGIGPTLDAARRPAVIGKNGVKIAFLSYTSVFWPSRHAAQADRPGTAVLPAQTAYQPGPRALEMPGASPEVVTWCAPEVLDGLARDVRAARQQADIVVASCHWGVSSSPVPAAYQRSLGRTAIEAGADLVVGHHPHVIQPIEYHRGRPIFFSLGNFAFDWPKMRGRHRDGMLLQVEIADKKISRIGLVPVSRDDDNQISPHAPDSAEGRRILAHIRDLSGAGAELRLRDGKIEIVAPVTADRPTAPAGTP